MKCHEKLEFPAGMRTRLDYLCKKVNRATREFDMIRDGDRIAVGVSGGKDSVALALALLYCQRSSPLNFEFRPVHIHWREYEGSGKKEALEEFLKRWGLEIDFVDGTLGVSPGEPISCFACSRRRRELLFRHCAEHGFHKLALGHHRDDAAQTALMNLFFHGSLETMEPKVNFFEGRVELIRPLILTQEKEIRSFARKLDFPFYGCACPARAPTERDRAEEILNSFGRHSEAVKQNIWRASRRWPKNPSTSAE